MFKNLKISAKILIPLVLSALAGSSFLFVYISGMYEDSIIEANINKSRALILAAEGMREYIANQNKAEVFQDSLTKLDDILKTVPIVGAMETAKSKADELGFKFKVPKNSPRNPDNQPDEYEKNILTQLEEGKIKEFYEVDEATNQIRYFRPIVLTEDCMRCHGDPNKSMEYWGRNDGKDITGTMMEDWNPGEVHGAFEVMVDMAPIRAEVNDKSTIIALSSGGLVLLITFFSLFVARNINGPVKKLTSAAEEFAKGNFKAEVDTNRSDEIGVLSKSFDEMRKQIVHTQTVNQEISDYQTNEAKKLSDGLAKLASGELKVDFSIDEGNENTKAVGQVFDGINFSIAKLRDIITQIIDDMKHMADQHELGQIDVILDTNKYQGAYKVMTSGVNEMVNAHINVKKMAINVVTEFGKGNFDADIEKLPGQKVFINNALDMVRNNLKSFDSEVSKLVEGAKNGNLDVRGDAKAFHGGWSKLVGGVNEILESMVEPINESSVVLQRMAEGDFTKPMNGNYKGAFDELKNNVNHTIDSLNALFAQINESVVTTSSTSAQLSSTAESMASAAEEQSSQTDGVASAVEEMSRTVMENSRSASHTADVANKNGQIAREGGEIVLSTVNKMKDIATVVKNSASNIQQLGTSSKEIGEIVSVIDDIADQTNMLALNAAIEAARAGEQGRGFAVVADEVRKLAERTTEATKKIAEMIHGIQKQTEMAVEAMNKGNQEVENGINLADNAGKSLNEIVNSSQELLNMIQQIAAASEQQSATSEEISQNVLGISQVTNETARQIKEIADSSDDLSSLTQNLSNLMAQFKFDANRKNGVANKKIEKTEYSNNYLN